MLPTWYAKMDIDELTGPIDEVIERLQVIRRGQPIGGQLIVEVNGTEHSGLANPTEPAFWKEQVPALTQLEKDEVLDLIDGVDYPVSIDAGDLGTVEGTVTLEWYNFEKIDCKTANLVLVQDARGRAVLSSYFDVSEFFISHGLWKQTYAYEEFLHRVESVENFSLDALDLFKQELENLQEHV